MAEGKPQKRVAGSGLTELSTTISKPIGTPPNLKRRKTSNQEDMENLCSNVNVNKHAGGMAESRCASAVAAPSALGRRESILEPMVFRKVSAAPPSNCATDAALAAKEQADIAELGTQVAFMQQAIAMQELRIAELLRELQLRGLSSSF